MKKILSVLFILGLVALQNLTDISFAKAQNTVKSIPQGNIVSQLEPQYINVKPLDIVKNPDAYLNKKICMTAKFSKFSTLGLDYKPAFKNSDKYISFLFLRDDAANNIPLSELKMFISRTVAEKLPDIKENDTVKVKGTLFSSALGDAWVDVDSLEEIKK